jgi:hypothetical protein
MTAVASAVFRDRSDDYATREALRHLARSSALVALVGKHPAEYAGLYERALADVGWTAAAMERPCECGGVIRRRVRRGRWPERCEACKGAGT